MKMYLFYSVGVIFNGVIFHFVHSWQTVLLLYLAVPCLISLIGVLLYI